MRQRGPYTLRSAALIGATVLLGISWSFALFHIRTAVYPFLWSAAMPLLSLYYFSRAGRSSGRRLSAAALSIYAAILWQVSRGYGAAGLTATVCSVLASLAAAWLGGRLAARAAVAQPRQAVPLDPPLETAAAAMLGSGVARRRRLRAMRAR